MPKLEIKILTDYVESFRTAKVAGMFDVPVGNKLEKTWSVSAPYEEKNWNVGLIIGSSGCGKTTIGKKLFGEGAYHSGFDWTKRRPFIDDFPENIDVKDIISALSSVGFSSPPSWLLPFDSLSNGQKFRTELARLLLEEREVVVVDEFTSIVDRTVAKITSSAVSKAVKRKNKKFVALSCHYDIKDWLEPDWVYEVTGNLFKWVRLRRPKIELQAFRCSYKAWELFKGHHYLNTNISKTATCFVALMGDEPVGFCSAIHFVHPKVKNTMREHRTVVLPDYQGVGIGNALSERVAQYFINYGKRYISITSHPAMIQHRIKSEKWIMYRKPGRARAQGGTTTIGRRRYSVSRLTASFEFIGS